MEGRRAGDISGGVQDRVGLGRLNGRHRARVSGTDRRLGRGIAVPEEQGRPGRNGGHGNGRELVLQLERPLQLATRIEDFDGGGFGDVHE